MRCLVTGATGHLGAFLTRHLLEMGFEVAVLVRPRSDLWRLLDVLGNVTLLYGALGDLDGTRELLHEWHPEVTFHLAWQGVTGDHRNESAQITRNVAGTLELFDIVQAAGCRVWIGVGSQAEYGPQREILREDLTPRPGTAYGVAKLYTGLLTKKLCEMANMRFVWIRLLATYGPMDDPKHLLPWVISRLLAGECPSLTPGEQLWDYLYVDDAVEAIARLGTDPSASGIFNLGSGEAISVRSVAEQIRDRIDPALPLGFGEIAYRHDQVMHLQADITKLTDATGWRPKISLAEGLSRTIDWHRSLKTVTEQAQ